MNKTLYKETFSQLHTSVEISEEWFSMKQRRPKGFWKRTALVAAAIAALLCCGLTAYAVYQYSLGDLSLGEQPIRFPKDPNDPDAPTPTEMVDMITFAGFQGTPEYRAALEWMEFRESYDPDEVIRHQLGNGPLEVDSRYTEYGCYTQEMADKLDEIINKYGLQLRGECRTLETRAMLEEQVGNFAPGLPGDFGGYLYDNGTFAFEGQALRENGELLELQFRRSAKGYLEDVALNVKDLDDYDQWQYQTDSGTEVFLALSPYKGLIYVDLGNSFVVVNVLNTPFWGVVEEVTRQDMEHLADDFDWKVLSSNQIKDPTPEMGEVFGVGSWSAQELAAGYGGRLSYFFGSWMVQEVRAVDWAHSTVEAYARVGQIITFDPDGTVIWNMERHNNLNSYEFWGGYTLERFRFDYKIDLTDWWPAGTKAMYHGAIPAMNGEFGTYFYTDGGDTLWIYDTGCFYRMEPSKTRSPLPDPVQNEDEDVPEYCGLWTGGELAAGLGGEVGGFMGGWELKEAMYCSVGSLLADDVDALLGTTITYCAEGIIRDGKLTPVNAFEFWSGYTPGRILLDYKADLSDWWIRISRMYSGNAASTHLPFGGNFFYDGNDALWIYYEGVFFRCERVEYEGVYNSYDTNEPDLSIQKNADGSYAVQIGIFRLVNLEDGVGTPTDHGMEFTATAPNGTTLTGVITVTGNYATVTFTGSEWSTYSNINVYRYYRA